VDYFHNTEEDYTFSPAAHGTFSKTDHILGHKSNFNRYKTDHNETKS
jgi:hypothetical protein